MANKSFLIRAPIEFYERIDDWRRKQPDIPSQSEAIRRLVEIGLKAKKKPKTTRKSK